MSSIDLLLGCLVVGKHLGCLVECGMERIPALLGITGVCLVLKRIVQCLELGFVNLRDPPGCSPFDVVES